MTNGSKQWKKNDSIIKNQTWEWVQAKGNEKDRQNAYSKILGNGATKQKARLVAIGYSQINGIDYKETFSPVVILTGSLVCSLPLSLCFSLSYSLVALHKDSIQSTWLYLSVPFVYVCWINQSPSLVDIALAISV